MRSFFVIAAGLAIGWLPIAVLESAIPNTAIPFNGEALRSAIADGMSRAGSAALVGDEGRAAVRRY